jgi:molecular chaperone HscC
MSVRVDDETVTLALDEPTLEQACAPLLKRLRTPVERALRDANLRGGQLDNVVLAGGATRMPMIRRLVTTMFGRFPAIDFNPDEVVALGAAVQAGLKAKDQALKEVVMTDVSPYSLGVEISRRLSDTIAAHGHFDPIIERNTPVPVSRVKTYLPMTRGQQFVDLNVFQGEARMVKDNVHLGRLRVEMPRGATDDAGVEVRFTYDVNGLLQVEATLRKTQQTSSLVIEGNPGLLTEQEIAARLRSLAELKIHPRDTLENRTLMARAERIYQQLRGEVREWLGAQITTFEQALAGQQQRAIASMQRQLEEHLNRIERDGYIMDTD